MDKNISFEPRMDAYQKFFDGEWFEKRTTETVGTVLYQPVFDLAAAWRYTGNVHFLPWLLATVVQHATEMNVNKTKPFGKTYVSVVHRRLVKQMGSSLRKAQQQRMQKELDSIYEDVKGIGVVPKKLMPDMMWQKFLQNSEFQFALVGSQRLCYAAVYYSYEDFLTRCVGLARTEPEYRMPRRSQFQKDFTGAFDAALCAQCWTDKKVNLARVTRHALVHNGCRVTDEFNKALKAAKCPLVVDDGEIQIMAPDTSSLFHLLKDRATQLITAALQHPNIKGVAAV
jgi:hypothetical protein